MKNRIFQLSIALNLITLTFVGTTLFLNSDYWRGEIYQSRLNESTHHQIKLIEQKVGNLSLDQKFLVRNLIQTDTRLPKGLCDAVYSPTQGGRDVSGQ